MNRKQFLVALAVLAVLVAAGAFVTLSDRSAWTSADSRSGQKLLAGLKISDVAEIAIKDSSGELHLQRGATGWNVRERASFAADADRIGELLVRLVELKIVQSEALPENQRARLELVEPKEPAAQGAGTVLELKDAKGGALGRLLLGKKILKSAAVASLGRGEAEATGRYLTQGGDANTMLAVGEPLTQAVSRPDQWLVKDLLRADGVKSVSSSQDGKPRWRVTRGTESTDWTFAGSKERPDLQKATDLASSLGWVNLVDVAADPKADTGLDHPVVIKAETFDGLGYTLAIGKQAGDNYYVKVAVAGEPGKTRPPVKGEKAEDKPKNDKEFDERRKKLIEKIEREKKLDRWVYLVAKNGVEPLLRDRAGLMPEKKRPAKKG